MDRKTWLMIAPGAGLTRYRESVFTYRLSAESNAMPVRNELMGLGMIFGYVAFWSPSQHWWENRAFDLIVQRIMDAIQAIPALVLALAIVSVLRPSTTNAMLAIAIVIIPSLQSTRFGMISTLDRRIHMKRAVSAPIGSAGVPGQRSEPANSEPVSRERALRV